MGDLILVTTTQKRTFHEIKNPVYAVPVSGIANNDVSVATRNVPWIEIPTPPPITTPSHNDSTACATREEAKRWGCRERVCSACKEKRSSRKGSDGQGLGEGKEKEGGMEAKRERNRRNVAMATFVVVRQFARASGTQNTAKQYSNKQISFKIHRLLLQAGAAIQPFEKL